MPMFCLAKQAKPILTPPKNKKYILPRPLKPYKKRTIANNKNMHASVSYQGVDQLCNLSIIGLNDDTPIANITLNLLNPQ